MKFLVDRCISRRIARELSEAGHDVKWVGDWPEDPGDIEILARAFLEGRVVITLDNDFGELAIAQHHAHSGIVRIVEDDFVFHASICRAVLEMHSGELEDGAIVVAARTRIRVRRAKV